MAPFYGVANDHILVLALVHGLLLLLGVTGAAAALVSFRRQTRITQEMGNELKQSEEKHRLVFMDCQMPEIDGYQATEAIRNPHTPVLDHDIPIIALTAYAKEQDRKQCMVAAKENRPAEAAIVVEKLENAFHLLKEHWSSRTAVAKERKTP